VPPDLDGARLDKVLRTLSSDSWSRARRLIESGKVSIDERPASDAGEIVFAGARIVLDMQAPHARGALPAAAIVHVDASLVVVNKSAGVSTVPYGDDPRPDQRQTLDAQVRDTLTHRFGNQGRRPLGIVQRLDKETSGLLVFPRTLSAKRHLGAQLRRHTMHRRYLAIAHGRVTACTVRSRLVKDRGDGLRGSTQHPKLGQLAVTHVEVLEAFADTTLIACRLETGRTHQIRIHLSERGHPLVGERVYVRDYQGQRIPAPRLMLHAAELGFEHPNGKPMSFHCDPPDDFQAVLARLRDADR
jgi:23S rRNA pseudouridine1911/1915/1917 synthase